MKSKKIIGFIAVLAIAAVAAFNLSLDNQESRLSDIALANVEDLEDEDFEQKGATTVDYCFLEISSGTTSDWRMFCDARTNATTIYPCPTQTKHYFYSQLAQDRCTK
jgi:hypothetical protein